MVSCDMYPRDIVYDELNIIKEISGIKGQDLDLFSHKSKSCPTFIEIYTIIMKLL